MYNNIGLRTPRGSGTSGHVMSNRSHVRGQAFRMGVSRNQGKLQSQNWDEPAQRKANGELLDHQQKRKVEAKIFELQEAMAERGYSDAEIEAKVAEVRKEVEERKNSGQKASLLGGKGKGGGSGGGAVMDSHVRGMQKEEENRRMREAFGLGEDYAAGEAFDEETQARKKEARKIEREAKQQEREAKQAARAAEEKRLRKEKPLDGEKDEDDDEAGDTGKGRRETRAAARGATHDGENLDRMRQRAERFGAREVGGNQTNGHGDADPDPDADKSRRGRGQFRAGGRHEDGGRGGAAGDRRNHGREEGRAKEGREGSDRASRCHRVDGGLSVRDALEGGLSAPRAGGRGGREFESFRGNERERGPERRRGHGEDEREHEEREERGVRTRPVAEVGRANRSPERGGGREARIGRSSEGWEEGRKMREPAARRDSRENKDGEFDAGEEAARTGVDENDRWRADSDGDEEVERRRREAMGGASASGRKRKQSREDPVLPEEERIADARIDRGGGGSGSNSGEKRKRDAGRARDGGRANGSSPVAGVKKARNLEAGGRGRDRDRDIEKDAGSRVDYNVDDGDRDDRAEARSKSRSSGGRDHQFGKNDDGGRGGGGGDKEKEDRSARGRGRRRRSLSRESSSSSASASSSSSSSSSASSSSSSSASSSASSSSASSSASSSSSSSSSSSASSSRSSSSSSSSGSDSESESESPPRSRKRPSRRR